MNSTSRTASRGGTKSKSEAGKTHKADGKRDNTKSSNGPKVQVTHDGNSHITQSLSEENMVKKKIAEISGIVCCTEDEAITALHDCDNDVNKAINLIYEGQSRNGAWETSGKKKKNRQASTSKGAENSAGGRGAPGDQDAETGEAQPLAPNLDREKMRGRGGPSRMRGRGGGENRGPGRGRENKENEGVGEDGYRGRGDGYRRGGRGASNGPGGRGSRGGRGGRLGSRTFQSRDRSAGDRFPSTIDTWNPANPQESSDNNLKMETWGDSFPAAEDWDNEEYTGSLADSKVFTPSGLEGTVVPSESIEESTTQDILNMSSTGSQDFHQTSALSSSPLPQAMGALNTAQAQYLSQFTQPSELKSSASAGTAYSQTESLKNAVGIGGNSGYSQSSSFGQSGGYGQTSYAPSSYGQTTGSSYGPSAPYQSSAGFPTSSPQGAYSSGSTAYATSTPGYQGANSSSYGVYPSAGATSYSSTSYSSANVAYDGSTVTSEVTAPTAQPARSKPQRARVPPPSKIPSSAVEMPDDSISTNVSSLDVQFGCLEFGTDSATFEPSADPAVKFTQTTSTSATVPVDAATSGVAATLDSSPQQSLDAYTSVSSKTTQQTLVSLASKALSNSEGLSIPSTADTKSSYTSQPARAVNSSTGLDLAKSDVSLSYQSTQPSTNYSSYQTQKNSSAVYQTPSYSTSSYTTPLPTYSNTTPSSYTSTTYNSQQTTSNSFPNSSYSAQPSNVAAVNYASAGATYPSANSFHNASQSYQSGSAATYGASLGYSNSASTGYQNSYTTGSSNSTKLNSSLGTTTQDYTPSTTTNTTSATLGLTTTPQTVTTTSTKVSTGQIKNSVVPSIHPQMMGPQFIMGGTSVPFYQTMYGFEDIQLMHSRISHMGLPDRLLGLLPHPSYYRDMLNLPLGSPKEDSKQPAGYYDMGYTAPTSLPGVTGRDTLASVAYTDARYSTRGDNNASPVPSTLSQQTATAAHQQPMIPPGYTYIYGMPGSYHQYSGHLYQVPSTGNAHGTSSSQYGKPSGYGSTYGSGYEGLNQTADYTKSAYVSGAGTPGKAGVAAAAASVSSSSDLYAKPHTALGKVNSYDKQAYHSGTPPPFNLAGGQSTGIAPSGPYTAGPVFIPAIPPHQQHHGTALMPSHLQDSTTNSGQRAQTTAQSNKAGNKQSYGHQYWSSN